MTSLHLVHPQSVTQRVEMEEPAPALVTVTVLLATAGHTASTLPLLLPPLLLPPISVRSLSR